MIKYTFNRSVICSSIKQVDSSGDIFYSCLGGGRLESQPEPAAQLVFLYGFPKIWDSKVDWIGWESGEMSGCGVSKVECVHSFIGMPHYQKIHVRTLKNCSCSIYRHYWSLIFGLINQI